MHGTSSHQNTEHTANTSGIIKLRWPLCLIIACLLPTACATDSNQASDDSSPAAVPRHSQVTPPPRSGAPPYPDDPEANGNPAKAWYN